MRKGGADVVMVVGVELVLSVTRIFGTALVPLARVNGVSASSTPTSVKWVVVFGLVLSVNFSVKTSLISFWRSGVRGTALWFTTPLLIWICCPAWLTTAIGCSVVLSNRT